MELDIFSQVVLLFILALFISFYSNNCYILLQKLGSLKLVIVRANSWVSALGTRQGRNLLLQSISKIFIDKRKRIHFFMLLLQIDKPNRKIVPDPIIACKVDPDIQAAFNQLALNTYNCNRAKLMRACIIDCLKLHAQAIQKQSGEITGKDFSG